MSQSLVVPQVLLQLGHGLVVGVALGGPVLHHLVLDRGLGLGRLIARILGGAVDGIVFDVPPATGPG